MKLNQTGLFVFFVILAISVFIVCAGASGTAEKPDSTIAATDASEYGSPFPAHPPLGRGIGAMPGRVVWAYNPDSVDWHDGYWWEFDNFDYDVIKSMIDGGIATLAGRSNAKDGWDTLFRYHNDTRGKGTVGYTSGEKIAIKTNMNGAGWSGPNNRATANVFTNPVALRALLVSLVENAGIAPVNITVFDASRNVPDYMREYCSEGILSGIQFRYSDLGGKNDCVRDRTAPVIWSKRFSGKTSYLPTCVTEAEYLINFADLKGHSMNGITLTAKNHFGTIMNSNRIASPLAANIHQFVTANSMGNYTVLVDLMANYLLGEKTILYVLDGIIVSPGEGATTSISSGNTKWQSAPFSNDYTSSLFFSQDPLAIDSVGADFLANEPIINQYNSVIRNNPNVENYLHEAGIVAHAPSGTIYKNGNGETVTNIGVHEHWNNPTARQYSRNLGKNEGIELIRISGNSRDETMRTTEKMMWRI
jgi:uncharacterized protein (DUF362 family)